MLPLLKSVEDGEEYRLVSVIPTISDDLCLSNDERKEICRVGSAIRGDLSWAKTNLKRAGLLEYIGGDRIFRITQQGRKVLKKPPNTIDRKYLRSNFEPYRKWRKTFKRYSGNKTKEDEELSDIEPNEAIKHGANELKNELYSNLQEKLLELQPEKFVELTRDLLSQMYSGKVETEKNQTRDGGIDGTIEEDELGLSKIYIQCKRYKGKVQEKEVRDFVGALHSKSTKKGIFITSGEFTPDAKKFIEKITDASVVLVNGFRLAELMAKNGVGVSKERTIEIMKVDQDYFQQFNDV